jgi:RimJ/RimL family protein N-acetyltransferase
MQLETERLLLRLPRLDDAEALLPFVGDETVMRPIGSEPGGIEVAVEHLERWIARWEVNGMGPFMLVRDGDVLGRVGPIIWNRRTWKVSSFPDAGADAEIELGWAIGSAHWGYGYATEAARAIRDWMYAERDVARLISLIAPSNARSIRVAEKLGATPTDTVQTDAGPTVVWLHPR